MAQVLALQHSPFCDTAGSGFAPLAGTVEIDENQDVVTFYCRPEIVSCISLSIGGNAGLYRLFDRARDEVERFRYMKSDLTAVNAGKM